MTTGAQAHEEALTTLEREVDVLAEPADLLALATRIDALGTALAREVQRLAVEPAAAAALHPLLLRVPAVHARALLRAAERFDDAGSPRRAAYVLLEVVRRPVAPDTLATAASALGFVLDAHGQGELARRLHALVTAGATPPADRAARREARARFVAALDELRGDIDWAALDDDLGLA